MIYAVGSVIQPLNNPNQVCRGTARVKRFAQEHNVMSRIEGPVNTNYSIQTTEKNLMSSSCSLEFNSGASAREARQRSTMGKKNW